MRSLAVLGIAASACGRIGFDARAVDAPPEGPPPCVAVTPVDLLASAVPTDPGRGLATAERYSTNADGSVIYDAITGLAWQAAPDLLPRALDAAHGYCASLDLDSCATWRVPQRIELASLVDHVTKQPTIAAVFGPTPFDQLWLTATPQAGSPANTWIVNFDNGNVFTDPATSPKYVRCVRSAVAPDGIPQRYRASTPTVLDIDTGLVWQTAVDATDYDFAAAQSRCANIGMRVPEVRELQSLVDSTRTSPAIDAQVFPTPTTELYWTATPLDTADAATADMEVDFTDGTTNNADPANVFLVRCVK